LPGADELPGGFGAVHARHADAHEDDVGGQLAADPYRLGPAAGRVDDREVGQGVQQRGEAGVRHTVIAGAWLGSALGGIRLLGVAHLILTGDCAVQSWERAPPAEAIVNTCGIKIVLGRRAAQPSRSR
jgi:hypothetical protein